MKSLNWWQVWTGDKFEPVTRLTSSTSLPFSTIYGVIWNQWQGWCQRKHGTRTDFSNISRKSNWWHCPFFECGVWNWQLTSERIKTHTSQGQYRAPTTIKSDIWHLKSDIWHLTNAVCNIKLWARCGTVGQGKCDRLHLNWQASFLYYIFAGYQQNSFKLIFCMFDFL